MLDVIKKIGTFKRVVRDRGMAGVMSVLKEKTDIRPLIQPPIDYARQSLIQPSLDYAKLAPSAFSAIARYGRPEMFITAVGAGIGDDLLCTVIFRELRQRNQHKFWSMSKHPELYLYNKDIEMVVPPYDRYDTLMKRLGVKIVYPWCTSYNPAYDRDDPFPEQHIISLMCEKAGILGPITLKPYLVLHESEMEQGQVVQRQIAIQSSGLNARHAMTNKDWFIEGYQGVVSSLKSKYEFVQIGSTGDPPLEGALDLRGKTTLRQTAALLSRSLAFVGQVGLLMHLARAVDCRSVIVYGGRERPSQSGYSCNENLYSELSCSPCWRLNTCPYDRECMRRISFADVVAALETQVEKHGTPLVCDIDTITQEQIERNALRYAKAVQTNDFAWSVLYN